MKRALQAAAITESYEKVDQCTRGIVFFGTPHHGGNGVPVGKVMATAARVIYRDPTNALLESLKKGSEYAKDLHRDFVTLIGARQWPIVSVVESRPTQKFGLKSIVVDSESGTIGLSRDQEVVISRNVNHSEVCTFDDPENGIFKTIVGHIKDFLGPGQPGRLERSLVTLSEPKSLKHLGFQSSDITTIRGLGRTLTWSTISRSDRNLLEDFNILYEVAVLRKGILEQAKLQKRWSKFTIFKEGRKSKYANQLKNDSDPFTWLMALIRAVLLAAFPLTLADETMVDFVVGFVDPEDEDSFRTQLPGHLAGWRSFVNVNGIEAAAQREWEQLERKGDHPAGSIPLSDQRDVLEFLKWLVRDTSPKFETSSGDVYCLAQMLKELGISLLQATKTDASPQPSFDENNWVVTLNTQLMNQKMAKGSSATRRGIRIPLEALEESVSPWPVKTYDNITVRTAFLLGKEVGEALHFALRCDYEIRYDGMIEDETTRNLYYEITTIQEADKSRIPNDALDWIANTYFPLLTKPLSSALKRIAKDWSPANRVWGVRKEEDGQALLDDRSFFGLLQSFVMGYYYAALSQLIDTSQLSVKEAYGSWGWWDLEVLQVVSNIWHESPGFRRTKSQRCCWRYSLLKAMAYLFAGAEVKQISGLDTRATGIVAKLSLLAASTLGKSTDSTTAAKFHLLDIDGSCIPNRAGIVLSGQQPQLLRKDLNESKFGPRALSALILTGCPKDFTVHIEPDWQEDPDSCLIAYRDRGRIVHRLSPQYVDAAMVIQKLHGDQLDTQKPLPPKQQSSSDAEDKFYIIPIAEFHGGHVVRR